MQFTFEKSISTNKSFEFSLLTNQPPDWAWFNCWCSWTKKDDHAGLNFSLEVLGRSIHIGIADNRHWDYANDRWEE